MWFPQEIPNGIIKILSTGSSGMNTTTLNLSWLAAAFCILFTKASAIKFWTGAPASPDIKNWFSI